MENNLDLWGNINCDNGITLKLLPLLEQQANLLSVKTNGIVKADFSKVKYQFVKKQNPMSVISSMATALSTIAPLVEASTEIKEVDEFNDLENANSLYENGKYKFELYSSKYRYRLFTLDFKSVFPIKIEVEYGILSDKIVTKEINSYEQMTEILSSIFTSNKVRFIIQRMIELDNQ